MDVLLVKKAKRGDKDCFVKLILEVKDQAYKIAYSYLKNEQDSMDAVCDAMEKAFINIRKLKEAAFFKTWFIRIVINEAKLQLRKKNKVILMADELYQEEYHEVHDREERMDLERLLDGLSNMDRLLIYMKYYMGYTLEEIAEMVELPLGTVKSKIYSNLKGLRDKLEYGEVSS